MLVQLAYAIALILATTLIHFGCTVAILRWLRSVARHHWALRNTVTRASVLAGLVLVMSLAALAESGLWAGFYLIVGALPDLEQALYFSLVTFTTLGYGDISLDANWRILAAIEAANGILMFGWTTALIVAVAQRFLRAVEAERT